MTARRMTTRKQVEIALAFILFVASISLTNIPRFRNDIFIPVLKWAWMIDSGDGESKQVPDNQKLRLPSQKVDSVLNQAEEYVGDHYKEGKRAMCAFFVRHVFEDVGVNIGITGQPVDGHDPSRGTANSFFGEDVGDLVGRKELKPGDLVAFYNTYGDFPPDTITHVGIYVGEGKVIDRPTSSKPVQKRKIDSIGKFATGVRPNAFQQSNFERSVSPILGVEEGYSNHKHDRGGPTKFGITETTAKEAGIEDITELSKTQAITIFKKKFWPACDQFDFPLSMACLNTAIHSGVGKAKEFNKEVDRNGDRYKEAIQYLKRQEEFYWEIITADKNPACTPQNWNDCPEGSFTTQVTFYPGWLNRSSALRKFVREAEQKERKEV